jgi:mono/diheme cytochrome c family protein
MNHLKRMLLATPLAMGLFVALPITAAEQQDDVLDDAAIAGGKELFKRNCAPCHGTDKGDFGRAMLPGTDALRIKYQGKLPAALEQRTDLTPTVIKTYVRRGTWSMPPFRKSELTDEQIDDISAYLAVSATIPR